MAKSNKPKLYNLQISANNLPLSTKILLIYLKLLLKQKNNQMKAIFYLKDLSECCKWNVASPWLFFCFNNNIIYIIIIFVDNGKLFVEICKLFDFDLFDFAVAKLF